MVFRLKKILSFALLGAMATLPLSASSQNTIVDIAVNSGSFKTLVAAVTEAELAGVLNSKGPFTVLAPTDDAFNKLPKGTVENLLKKENRDQLVSILKYHVISGEVKSRTVASLDKAETLLGETIAINLENGQLRLNDANIVKADIQASNGIIHVVDTVLLPPKSEKKTIPEIAIEAGIFKTLVAALSEAELVSALNSKGPFTVLAPTDDAFAKLPKGTVESLLLKENRDQLVSILKYHVIPGAVKSREAVALTSAKTLLGESLKISFEGAKLKFDEAQLIKTDIEASNGIVHVIDSVLMPSIKSEETVKMMELIDMSIAKGVPLYNHGQQAACEAIYTICASSLLMIDSKTLGDEGRMILSKALKQVSHSHNADSNAWTLRRALDKVYSMLEQGPKMSMSSSMSGQREG